MDNLEFDTIIVEDSGRLEAPFSEEEVIAALGEMAGDKAPGPDGFSIAFFQQCWKVIRLDVMAVFKPFFDEGVFERSLNSSFIVLIPKKAGAEDIRDYRPISLIGSEIGRAHV